MAKLKRVIVMDLSGQITMVSKQSGTDPSYPALPLNIHRLIPEHDKHKHASIVVLHLCGGHNPVKDSYPSTLLNCYSRFY